jgi:hypothetical protein
LSIADQHVDQVMRAEALAGAVHRRQCLLRGDRAVPAGDRRAAIVAIAAGRMIALAEIAEEGLAPARHGLAKPDQRLGFLALDAALRLAQIARFDEAAQVHHVGDAIAHPRIGREPVASGPAGLLVIGFEVFRSVEMRNETHIRLVDAHAEGDGGDNDDAFLVQKAVLVALARPWRETGVVGQRLATALAEPGGIVLDGPPGQAIDDARIAGVLVVDKPAQILARVVLCQNPVEQVRAVIAGGEQAGRAQMQPLGDIAARRIVGGRGQRHQRRRGKALLQNAERLVVTAKIVAPLRDAMRLVDREEGDPAPAQHVEAMRHHQAFGRHVEEVERPVADRTLDRPGIARRQSGIERGGAHTGLPQGVDLVLHQRDQGRDDDSDPGAQQRRQLIAQGFAAAGRHQHDRVAAADNVLDDLLLMTAKAGVAEDAAQEAERG